MALAEALEPRQLLTVTGAVLNPPTGAVEGNIAYLYPYATTNHDPTPTYWTINFGDGTSATTTVNGSTSIAHTYSEMGTYYATAEVNDTTSGGSYYYCSNTVTVADAAISPYGGSYATYISTTEGSSYGGVVAHFSDANPNKLNTDFVATVNFGDGMSATGTIVHDMGGGLDVIAIHTFAEAGSYTGTVAIHDNETASLTMSLHTTTYDAPLSPTGLDIYAALDQSWSGVVCKFVDANPDGASGDFSATVVWGDGSSGTGTVTSVDEGDGNNTFDVYAGHTFSSTTPNPIAVTIFDVGGSEASCDPAAHILELSAKTVLHNGENGDLPTDQQSTVGAFVPLNNNDLDYDGTQDYLETGVVNGEDLLLPVVLHATGGDSPGYYTLQIPSNIRVWQNSDRTGVVDATTTFSAANDTVLYVEGYAGGHGTLIADWSNSTTSLDNASSVKITTFDWAGALDVPGYAKYNYSASGALSTSVWSGVSGGTLAGGYDTANATILWGEGDVVGKAAFEVNDQYTWDLEVNVVKISITANTVSLPTGLAAAVPVDTTQSFASPQPGESDFKISVAVDGPLDGRGVKFMQIGYIQDGTAVSMHASYPGNKRRTFSPEGNSYVDPANLSAVPWTDSNNSSAFWSPTSANAAAPNNTHDFDNEDAPFIGLHTTLDDTIPGPELLSGSVVFQLSRYLAVKTTCAELGSELVYTQRASVNWRVDLSGGVDATNTYNPSGIRSVTGSDPTAEIPTTFSIVEDGSTVPIVSGQTLNDAITNGTWTTDDDH